MGFLSRTSGKTEQQEAEARGDAFELFIAQGDAAVDESENERAARAANRPTDNT